MVVATTDEVGTAGSLKPNDGTEAVAVDETGRDIDPPSEPSLRP